MRNSRRGLRLALALGLPVVAFAVAITAATAKPPAGFVTARPALLAPVAAGVEVKPLLNVGDTVGGYKFESLPDGIAVEKKHGRQVDVYVNHETSLVPFGARGANSTNAPLRNPTPDRKSGGTPPGSYATPNKP